MGSVVVVVFPRSAVRPHEISEAARQCGHSPVHVAAAGALDEAELAEYASFGPVVEADEHNLETALERLRPLRAAGVTTFSEGMVPFTSRLAHSLGLPYHDHETAIRLTDKRAQRRRLAEAGVDAVWSVPVTSRTEALAVMAGRPGPFVVKPVRGQSSIDTHFVGTAADLPADLHPTEDRPFLVEEYLRGRDEGDFGDYVSVESLVMDGQVHTLGVTGKFPLMPPFREHGQFVPSHLPAPERADVARLATDAALALGVVSGLVHTEIKLTAGGPRIIEVNGRMGGFMPWMYRRATGLNLLELGIRAACGFPVEIPEPVAKAVEFQYWGLSPLPSGALMRADGADVLLKEPGVVGYEQRLPDGADLPAQSTSFFMDVVHGSAPDHRTMLETIDRSLAHMRFTFREPSGAVTVWQAQRGSMVRIDQTLSSNGRSQCARAHPQSNTLRSQDR
ncbi:ATP-grasp domain-containing protein [Streptomyces yunnanensis]|uniref:ATP-grasp domain-containing protein n=1 Tax=Streptomyces yunnanensis TaxID=156453 RepID=A0A9X8MPS5_9ACTN|nr:ATP-grasp domain-containing protein [Streptomyces yunnanensis]SHL36120.1 ATP-grasp domain-containing protein [Streptomyces yunnanensis]